MRSDGKRVICISLCLILVLSVFFSCFLSTYAYGNEVPQTADVTEVIYDGSRYIDFNDNWKFYLATRTPTPVNGDVTKGLMDPEGAPTTNEIINPAFDDSSWRTLNVPHDWSIEGEKVSNANNSQGYLQGGLGWYRKTFILPESMAEKKIFIEFDGVYAHSIVYVNGEMVGEYPNGYTGFSYEITPYVTFGPDNPNVIVVKVMNMAPSGRWYTGSGIVNPVNLIVTDKTFFLRHGITYKTPDLENTYNEDGSATLDVKAEIYSDAPNGVAYIKTTVYDKVIPDVKLNISECSPKYSGRADAKSDPNHPEGFQYSIQSQGDDTAELLKIINDVPDNRGQGVWPWAGTNVFFTGGWGATQGEPRASMKVWKDAYATNVVESGVYVTTKEGEAPVLPSTVKNLDVATGVITDVPVEWDAIDPQEYAKSGTFTVNGVADTEGNMKDVVATVSVLETDPVIGIAGPEKVLRGKEFDINLTLTNMEIASENLPEEIYAADITVHYDADLFDFVESNKVNEKTLICDTREIGPGAVRIILSSNEKYIADNSLVKLTFRAKNVDESTSGNIRVEKALLGTAPIGYVVNAAGDVLTVSVDVIPGDVNGDGEVNIADLSFASFYYSVEAGDPNWEAAKSADINNDGKIDLIDLVYIAYRIQ